MSNAKERNAKALEYISDPTNTSFHFDNLRAILQSPPKRHVFGGVTFVETGEVRDPRWGDWWLCKTGAGAYFWPQGAPRHITDSRGRQADCPSRESRRILRYVPEGD